MDLYFFVIPLFLCLGGTSKKEMKYLGKKLIMRWNTKYFNLTDFY